MLFLTNTNIASSSEMSDITYIMLTPKCDSYNENVSIALYLWSKWQNIIACVMVKTHWCYLLAAEGEIVTEDEQKRGQLLLWLIAVAMGDHLATISRKTGSCCHGWPLSNDLLQDW